MKIQHETYFPVNFDTNFQKNLHINSQFFFYSVWTSDYLETHYMSWHFYKYTLKVIFFLFFKIKLEREYLIAYNIFLWSTK